MKHRQAALAAVIITFSLLLTGCGGRPQVEPDLTKEAAKVIAQDGEDLITTFIPTALVASIDQHPVGALLSCQGNHNYTWGGGTDVQLTGGEVSAIIDTIVESGAQDGWRAQRETAAAGDPRAVLYGPQGDVYVIDGLADRMEIGISSFSPCFHLPDDEYPASF